MTAEFPSQRQLTRSFDVFWINSWVNNHEAGALRRRRAHHHHNAGTNLGRRQFQPSFSQPTRTKNTNSWCLGGRESLIIGRKTKVFYRIATERTTVKQSLVLNSTFITTSWNYILSEQDGFGVVNGCVGWRLEKNKSPKVCFHKCKLILPKIQLIEFRFYFICCCSWVVLHNDTSG